MTPLEVAQAYAAGATYRDLATELGASKSRVGRMITAAEVETGRRFRRPRGPRPVPTATLCALCQGIVTPDRTV